MKTFSIVSLYGFSLVFAACSASALPMMAKWSNETDRPVVEAQVNKRSSGGFFSAVRGDKKPPPQRIGGGQIDPSKGRDKSPPPQRIGGGQIDRSKVATKARRRSGSVAVKSIRRKVATKARRRSGSVAVKSIRRKVATKARRHSGSMAVSANPVKSNRIVQNVPRQFAKREN